jgi:hypothetical protein
VTRRHADDPEHRRPSDVSDLPIFAPTATQVGLAARDLSATRHARDIERLAPIARELAAKVGVPGITVSDIRIVAVQRGVLTGAETGRELSYLSAVPPAAGLEPTGEYRRSVIVKTHGNLQQIWRLPEAERLSRAPECSVGRDAVPQRESA